MKAETTARGTAVSPLTSVAICLALLVLVGCVFGQARNYSFVNYDDGSYVYRNTQVMRGLSVAGAQWAFTHIHSQNWHPLTTLSHMLDCQVFGGNPAGPHLVNIVLHALNALLLFLVLRRLTCALWRSAFVAAAWALHPLRVESVAWISERKDVLSGLFFFLTLAAYLRYADGPSILRYLVVALLLAAGLMAKPMLVTMPLVLLLLDYWPLCRGPAAEVGGQRSEIRQERRSWGRLILEKVPLILLSAGSGVATLLAQRQATGSADELPFLWRVENAVVSCAAYIGQTFWPVNLSVFYAHPEGHLNLWHLVGAVLLLVALSVLVFVWRRKYGYLVTGWLWFLVMLLPVLGLVQVGLQGHADRYTYLPQIGLVVMLTWGIADLTTKWRQRFVGLSVMAASILIGLSLLAWRQVGFWKDSETLWSHALAVDPDSDVAHAGRGDVLLGRGEVEKAIQDFEAALKVRPDNAEAHGHLAEALMRKGQSGEAIAHFEKALAMQPEDVGARDIFGAALAQEGRLLDAMTQWRASLRYDPDDGNALSNLAWVLAASADDGRRDGATAVEYARRASELAGGRNPMILRTLAAAYAEKGQFPEAVETAARGVEAAMAQGNPTLAEELRRNSISFKERVPMRDFSLTTKSGR